MTVLENALVWLYVKTWGAIGEHLINENDLWNFGAPDLETAITRLAYARKRKFKKEEKSELEQDLTNLIMDRLNSGVRGVDNFSGK